MPTESREVLYMKENSKQISNVLRGHRPEISTGRAGSLQVLVAVFLAAIMAITVMPMNASATGYDTYIVTGYVHKETITGEVPVEGALVYINNSRTGDSLQTNTGPDGVYSVDISLYPNGYKDRDLLLVTAIDLTDLARMATKCGEVNIENGDTTTVSITLDRNSQQVGSGTVTEDEVKSHVQNSTIVVDSNDAKARPKIFYNAVDDRYYEKTTMSINYFYFCVSTEKFDENGGTSGVRYIAEAWVNMTLPNRYDPWLYVDIPSPFGLTGGTYAYFLNVYTQHWLIQQGTNKVLNYNSSQATNSVLDVTWPPV